MGSRRVFPSKFSGKIRKSRRVRKTSIQRLAVNGVTYNVETQNTVNDLNCVYVAHTTSNYQQFAKYFCYALLKEIVRRKGIDINNWADQPIGFAVADQMTLAYQANPTVNFSTINYPLVAADVVSYETVANAIWINIFFSAVETGLFTSRSIMRDFAWQPVGDRIFKFAFSGGYINIHSKSALKMQNRTVTDPADFDSNDVNAMPIIGRSYDAKGSSIYPKDISSSTPPNRVTGVSSFAATENSMREPPQPYFFSGVRGSSKVKILPGGIKTSLLTHSFNISINNFWVVMSNVYILANDDFHSVPFGSCRYFAFEKVIGNIGAEAQPVQLAYECENTLNMKINLKSTQYTAPIVEGFDV